MEFKVVKIVDEYLVVIDYGEKHNAQEGDLLEIFQIGEKVYDIDASLLGTLDVRKGRIRVLNVYKNMSLCKSDETIASSNVGVLFRAFSNSQVVSLNVDVEQITGGYSRDKELIIQLGDPVKILKSRYLEEVQEEANGEEED